MCQQLLGKVGLKGQVFLSELRGERICSFTKRLRGGVCTDTVHEVKLRIGQLTFTACQRSFKSSNLIALICS